MKAYQAKQQQTTVSRAMLIECQNTIIQLKNELQHALKLNNQKQQIIGMLTEQKQFYLQEARKFDQNTYGKLKEQINWSTSLTQGLKQYNKELTEKCKALTEQNKLLMEELHQKQIRLKEMQLQIGTVNQEKKKLQRQWNQTLVCVRKKIFQLNSGKELISGHKMQPVSDRNQRYQKARSTHKISKPDQVKVYANTNQKSKVENILSEIDNKLLNYEFLEMIKGKEIRNKLRHGGLEINKENIQTQNNLRGNQEGLSDSGVKGTLIRLNELELQSEKENYPVLF